MLRRRYAVSAAFVLITVTFVRGAIAQPAVVPAGAAEAPTQQPVPAPSVADKRAENADLVRAAEEKVAADPNNAAAAAELAAYKTAETILAQQEAVDQQIADLQTREGELRKVLESSTNRETPQEFPFIEFDRLVNRLAAENARTELVRSKLKAAKAAFEQAENALAECEQERRKAQEALELGQQNPDAAVLATAVAEAKRASALATDTLALRKKELERDKLAEVVQQLTVELLENRITRNQSVVVFSEADLAEQLKKLKSQEESVRTAMRRADDNASLAAREWAKAKRRRSVATGDRTILIEETEAWRRAIDAARDEKNTALDQLLQLEQLRTAWTRLYKLMSGTTDGAAAATPEELAAWKEETNTALKILIGSTQSHLLRIEDLRAELATILTKADGAKDGAPELLKWIDKQRTHVEAMIRTHETNLVSIDASRRLHGKLRTELGRGIDLLSPERLASEAWSKVVWAWDYEIAAHEDRPITVGKILRAMVIFGIGWLLAGTFSKFFAHRLLRRFRFSRDAIAVVRTVLYYSLVVVAVLVALRSAHVPLTAFTILGGAVAISVGFGSQTLINNFLSGLIMLAERPVRIGERVLFGRFDGVIEDVGFRCTKLRTGTDHLVTIPNSSLINESIENIGRRRTIQRTLNLQVTYETPRQSIAAAVQAIRAILEEPGIREPIHPIVGWEKHQPRVWFNDFNAESLNIQVSYQFAPPDQGAFHEHSQQVNFRIVEEFERLGVAFAFPSRRIYLADGSRRELAARVASQDAA